MTCNDKCVRNAGFLLTYSQQQEELLPAAAPADPIPLILTGGIVPHWRSIGLEHDFNGPIKDLVVKLDGVETDPMVWNPRDGLHYASIYVPKDTPCVITLVDPGGATRSVVHDFGEHDGASDDPVLTDTTKAWTVDEFAGQTIRNLTDGSSGKIVSNTANTITATLAGGIDNDWDVDDRYEIIAHSLAEPPTPVAARTRYVGPEVTPSGGDYSAGNPGNIQDAANDEASGDKIILYQGSRAAPSVVLPYPYGDLVFNESFTDGQIVAAPGESPVISAFKQGAIVWTDESATETPGMYSTPTFEADQHCMFVVIDGEYQRVPHRADLAHMDPARYLGTHDGSADSPTLDDSTQAWSVNEFQDVNKAVFNITDGSKGKITSNTASQISHSDGLSGGVDNNWDPGDAYLIVPYDSSGWTIDSGKLYVRATLAQRAHDGSDNASVMTDSQANFTVDEHVGRIIWNLTDGSAGIIAANTANTVTATLSGGTDNDWDTDDIYMIVLNMLAEVAKIPDAFQDVLNVNGDRWHIDGITVEGCGAGASFQNDGIIIRGNDSVVKNVKVRGVHTRSIISTSNSRVLIRNSNVEDRKLLLSFQDIKAAAGGSQFNSEASGQIYIDDSEVHDVSDCYFNGHMDAIAVKDGIGPCREINVHHNTFEDGYGELLDWDGSHQQIRRWANRGTNCSRALALVPGERGPYIFANERFLGVGHLPLVDVIAGAHKFSLGTAKFADGLLGLTLVYNCTMGEPLYDPSVFPNNQIYGWRIGSDAQSLVFVRMRNCIWTTYGRPFYEQSTVNEAAYDLDYNVWYTSNLIGVSSNLFRWNDVPLDDFAQFQSASGQEENGLGTDPQLGVDGKPAIPIPGIFLPGITNNATIGLTTTNRGAE